MASLLRVFIIALLFYLVIWVVRGLIRPDARPGGPAEENLLVSDELTGLYFEKSKAITVKTNGKTYYFSNAENRDTWLRRNAR
ncbi:MAG: hypothetical protein LBG06_12590 [Deltaproteobacteria bacterium]|jgi:hypothetical protein|nr:hypothetical protein [Deltaproteobacteria bacterium]